MLNDANLQKQFHTVEKFIAGKLGVHACHIETNQTISFNAEQRFLMCSTYKVVIAIYLLNQVEAGKISLNDIKAITAKNLLPGIVSTLNQLNYDVPQQISLHSLLSIMLQESCNSATGIILDCIGGPKAIDVFLQKNNILGIGMDFYNFAMFAEWDGIEHLPKNCTLAEYKKLELATTPAQITAARQKVKAHIAKTGESTTQPKAMTNLLVKLFRHELINPLHTELLLKIMRGCKRGPLRLMGMLPPRTPVAHKTGSLTSYTCDIGIITLPHEAGHIAISVYIEDSVMDLANNERAIAEVSRMLFDFYLFSN
jgi:beta-lactamase class A